MSVLVKTARLSHTVNKGQGGTQPARAGQSLSDNSGVVGDGKGGKCGERRWARDKEQRITYLVHDQGNERTCQPIQLLVDSKYLLVISCLFPLSELPSAPKIRAGVHLQWDTSVGLSSHAFPFWDLVPHLHVYEDSCGHAMSLWFWGDLEGVSVRDKQLLCPGRF